MENVNVIQDGLVKTVHKKSALIIVLEGEHVRIHFAYARKDMEGKIVLLRNVPTIVVIEASAKMEFVCV